MARSEIEWRIEEEIEEWRKRLETALWTVINSRRRARNLDPYPRDIDIWIPRGPNANMFLLTLKVWSIKYHVTPEWLLDKLMNRFKHLRKSDDNPDFISLGLPAPMLVGQSAHNAILEAIELSFPSNENKKSYSMPAQRKVVLKHFDFSNPKTLMEYAEAVEKQRKRFKKKLKAGRVRKRNYRQI